MSSEKGPVLLNRAFAFWAKGSLYFTGAVKQAQKRRTLACTRKIASKRFKIIYLADRCANFLTPQNLWFCGLWAGKLKPPPPPLKIEVKYAFKLLKLNNLYSKSKPQNTEDFVVSF
jgi:hypothetical protein